MGTWMIPVVVLLPIVGALGIRFIPFKKRGHLEIYMEALTILTAILAWIVILNNPGELVLLRFGENAAVTMNIDGLGKVFSGLVSTLWPIAVLYTIEYMTKEDRERTFFMYYVMTFGVTLGISWSGNLLTMYFFYELLTLVTIPLVIHTYTRDAVLATRKYIYYSLGGAAMGLMAVVFLVKFGNGIAFTMGGVLGDIMTKLPANLVLVVFVLAFLGFSIKAAMVPFFAWLPDAGVAPTPVTALLHAVAVVKAGAFAVIRLTYYCFGTDLIRGTWAQYVVMTLAAFTIVFGCSMAVKETHLKRRLAYSTVANLSYIIFGATVMTQESLQGSLTHMVFHAVMKISAFFCAGAIIHQTECNYIDEMDGFGRKMPLVYTAFLISSLGMMGVPGFCGFVSKWYLAQSAMHSGNKLAIVGVGCLLVSALLTTIYMMSFVIRGFFPGKDFDYEKISYVKDPNWKMIVPLALFSIAIVYFGLNSTGLTNFLAGVAGL